MCIAIPPRFPFLLLPLLLCGSQLAPAAADVTVGWRGDGSGSYPDAGTVVAWDVATGTNVLWACELPARGTASPVFGPTGQILLACEPADLVCISDQDGSVLWRRRLSCIDAEVTNPAQIERWYERFDAAWLAYYHGDPNGVAFTKLGKGKDQERARWLQQAWRELAQVRLAPSHWGESGYFAGTPVTDGTNIVVRHMTNVLACYTWNGDRKWLVKPTLWDQKTYDGDILELASPLIVDDLAITVATPSGDRTEAFCGVQSRNAFEEFVAYDLANGRAVWRSEPFRTPGWLCSTPAVLEIDGRKLVLTGGGGVIDARTGQTLARKTGWCGSSASPAVHNGDTAVFLEICSHTHGKPRDYIIPGHSQVYAVRYRFEDGRLQWERLWEWNQVGERRSFSSPLIHDGTVVVSGEFGMIFDLETGTGIHALPSEPKLYGDEAKALKKDKARRNRHKRWKSELKIGGLGAYPSPVACGRHVYVPFSDGRVKVFRTGGAEPLVVNTLPDPERTIANPAIHAGRFYLRTDRHLYCFGKE